MDTLSGNQPFRMLTAWLLVVALSIPCTALNSTSRAGAATIAEAGVAGTPVGYLGSYYPSISNDGRYVVFIAHRQNPGSPADNAANVITAYRMDLQTEQLDFVAVLGLHGEGGSGPFDASISGDGRYVVFESARSDLVDDDTNNRTDVFVKDMTTRVISRASVSASNRQVDSDCRFPRISTDGRYVSFSHIGQVYVKDRSTGELECVSTDSAGNPSDSLSYAPALVSDDGRYVTFLSQGANLVPGDVQDWRTDVFVKDRLTGETKKVGYNGGSPSMSPDGRYLAYQTTDETGKKILLKDLVAGTTARVDTDQSGNPAYPWHDTCAPGA